jgi:hypothetical protein
MQIIKSRFHRYFINSTSSGRAISLQKEMQIRFNCNTFMAMSTMDEFKGHSWDPYTSKLIAKMEKHLEGNRTGHSFPSLLKIEDQRKYIAQAKSNDPKYAFFNQSDYPDEPWPVMLSPIIQDKVPKSYIDFLTKRLAIEKAVSNIVIYK